MIYRINIEKGEDFGYVAHCPAIPGCHSQGETMEEALENIKDAIRGCLEALDEELIPPISRELTFVEVAV
ncbi:MAG: type II toxin-antitoxin system HicB family antitoxin [Deltaproteobacteria bacterium]|nr:type II toxin-antitoxin system HicB family antitoxin [Deltaproteobacteria bacterium]